MTNGLGITSQFLDGGHLVLVDFLKTEPSKSVGYLHFTFEFFNVLVVIMEGGTNSILTRRKPHCQNTNSTKPRNKNILQEICSFVRGTWVYRCFYSILSFPH